METIEDCLECETRRKDQTEIDVGSACGGGEIHNNHMSFRLCNIFRQHSQSTTLCRSTETQKERPSMNPILSQCKSFTKYCLLT